MLSELLVPSDGLVARDFGQIMVVITSFPNFGLQSDKQPPLIYSVLPLFMHSFFLGIYPPNLYAESNPYQETPHETTSSTPHFYWMQRCKNALKTMPTQFVQLHESTKGLYSKIALLYYFPIFSSSVWVVLAVVVVIVPVAGRGLFGY